MGSVKKVLVVDDSSATRDYYQACLEPGGVTVVTAFNGIEGIEIMAKHQIDALLVDINMPKMDGLEFVRTVRAAEVPHTTPIAIISSQSLAEARPLAYEAGANAYLIKPVRPEHLATLLRLFGIPFEEVLS